jgi:hypothetical protein
MTEMTYCHYVEQISLQKTLIELKNIWETLRG